MWDRRQEIRSIPSEASIGLGAVQSIQNDILGMSKVSTRWVPRMLNDDQKGIWLNISRYLLSCYEEDPNNFIQQAVTFDETRVLHIDPDSKLQSKQWKQRGSALPNKFKGTFSREGDGLNLLG